MSEPIFLHIPKTGGMSITAFCIENNIKIDPINRSENWCQEKNLDLGQELFGRWHTENVGLSKYTFAFVRNPFDRMVSCFHSSWVQRPNECTFKEFLDFIFYESDDFFSYSHALSYFNDSYKLFDRNENLHVDFLGRFEKLEEDFKRICRELNLKYSLEHLNKSQRGDYRNYYDTESKKLVSKVFEKDLDYFKYVF